MRIWKLNPETNCYELYFEPFYDEILVATLKHDSELDGWQFTNVLANSDVDILWVEDLNDAKTSVEESIDEYLADQIEYFTHLRQKFNKSN